MWIIARKAYRFNNPRVKLADALKGTFERGSKAPAEGVAYVEVHPAVNPSAPLLPSNAYGDAVNVPEWVRDDNMFKWALADRDIVIVPEPKPQAPTTRVMSPEEESSIAATLSAASSNAPENLNLGGESTDIANAPEAELVETAPRARKGRR